MAASCQYEWQYESFPYQKKKFWPKEGQHIMAQYDDDTVIVYQAYNREIAEYAVKHQRFGGEHFSYGRMSWIKTNFLWMMYRCGWASKNNQKRVLAVRITRQGFDEILANAYTAMLQKSKKLTNDDISVRLQWDPDHCPKGGKLTRRAIQLGLKGDILLKYGTDWIVQIDDITPFVMKQFKVLEKDGEDELITAKERVYHVNNPNIATRIQLDVYEEHHRTPVVVKHETAQPTICTEQVANPSIQQNQNQSVGSEVTESEYR